MSDYKTSFNDEIIAGVARNFGTPFWLYDRSTIEERVRECQIFDCVRYAQKASSNLGILALMKKLGVVVDAVSAGEIVRALKVGYTGREKVPGIVYTADIFDQDALDLVRMHHIPVNVGSPDMIRQLHAAGIRTELTIRVNPGFGHGHSRKTNTGGPLSKHGIWHESLAETLKLAQELEMPVSGLHMHIGSGADFEHLSQVCNAMVEAARPYGAHLKTISAGGGLPIPYNRANPERIDIAAYFKLWNDARKRIESMTGHPVALEVEPGRYLIAESAVLVSEIRAIKKMGDNLFYLVDAGFTDLVRPSFYGSYHHISVLGRDGRSLGPETEAVVAGPLCESGDVFTQEEGGFVVTRSLPLAQVGDLLVLHDAGAYGSAMSSNYNTRRYAPELLWNQGKAELLRERQSFEHLLANERIPQF